MDEIDKYQLVYDRRMSSKDDIKALAREILIDEGFNPDIVNFKEEGITIQALNKLVKAIYIAGYKDGKEDNASLIFKRKELEKRGMMLTKHKRRARHAKEQAEKNLISHII